MTPGATRAGSGRERRQRFVGFVVLIAMTLGTGVVAVASDAAANRLTATPTAAADPAWQALGGIVTADPSVATDPQDPSGVYTFVRGSDDGLYWYRTAGSSSSSGAGGGFLTSQPIAVADPTGVSGNVGVYTFVRGGDGALYVGRVSGGTWQGWESLGGYLDFFPGATVDSTGLWVGVRGGDGGLYARRLLGGQWSPWIPFGGYLTSAPSMVGDSSGVYAFASGGDQALYARDLSGGDWEGLGGYLTSGPVATADASGISVVVRGGDGGAYRRHETGGAWASYEPLGGFLSSPPVAVADSAGVSVYGRGGDGGLDRDRFDGGSWHGWTPLGGYLASSPAAVADGAGFEHVAVAGGDAGLYTMSVEGAAIGGPPVISIDPSLFPSFSPGVHDYVSRCSAAHRCRSRSRPRQARPYRWAEQPPASGSFTATVTCGRGAELHHRRGGIAAVRHLLRATSAWDFLTGTVQQSGPTQAEYYVLGGAFAKYVFIVDTDGVPLWWDVPPNPAVFGSCSRTARAGGITLNGTAKELPLTGSPVKTIAGPVPGTSVIDNHDFLQPRSAIMSWSSTRPSPTWT